MFILFAAVFAVVADFVFFCVRHMHDIFTNRLFFSAFSTLSCLCYFFASTVKRITSFFTRDMSHALVYVCIYVFFFLFRLPNIHIILQMQKVMAQVFFVIFRALLLTERLNEEGDDLVK